MEVIEQVKQAIDDSMGPLMTAARQRFEKLEGELKAERAEREALELKIGRVSLYGGGSDRGLDTKALHDEREAIGAFIAKGDGSKLIEMKAMSVGSDPNGGYLVLPAMSQSMNVKLFDQSAMRRVARVETIQSGDAWEEIEDHDEPDAEWVGEVQSRSETATPEVGLHRVTLHEIHASPRVTQKILDTSQHDVGAWLEGKVADKFGRTEGVSFITGSGVAQPFGLLSGTPVSTSDATRAWGTLQYKPSGGAAALAASNPGDALSDVVWSLRAPYRRGATWMMNSNTANTIDKIKNGTGDYIWRDGMTAGAPPSLLG